MRRWVLGRWLAVAAAAFAVGFVMNNPVNALQNSVDDAKWIAQLKKAPLSQIEEGLPNKAFALWFSEHTKDAEVNYQIEACDGSANVESLAKGTYSCVTVTAVRGAASESVMRFLVVSEGENIRAGKYSCKFVIGQDGPPPGSMVKRPTRVFRSLSEMIKALGWQ